MKAMARTQGVDDGGYGTVLRQQNVAANQLCYDRTAFSTFTQYHPIAIKFRS